MQLTHKISGVSLIMFAVLAFSGFFVAANADENNRAPGEWNDWNHASCEVRHDSWEKGNRENWSHDGWWWDAEFGYWEKCDPQDDSKKKKNSHNDRSKWKDDDHDGRCDWDGKDWDTWHRDNNKKDWKNESDWNKDWDKRDDWKKDENDHDWKDTDNGWKDDKDGRDGKDGNDWDKDRKNDNDWNKNDHSYKNTSGASAHASVRSFISANTNLIRIR